MEKYNYFENVTADAKQAILENLNYWKFSDREELEEIANDELWVDDSVTGNGSGSYTFFVPPKICFCFFGYYPDARRRFVLIFKDSSRDLLRYNNFFSSFQSKLNNKRIAPICTTFTVNIYSFVICIGKAN